MKEPGIDRHVWATEWEQLEEDVRDSPADSLGRLDDLVRRMLEARGVAVDERQGEGLAEHEAAREFRVAREIARRRDAGEAVDPGDVAHAVDLYRELYWQLLEFGPEPGRPA